MTETKPTVGPSSDRDPSIDALRGLCLLGIAIVNAPWIGLSPSLPDLLWDDTRRAALPLWDLGSALFVEGLCEGKFYPQFAALFGLGAGILMSRGRVAYTRRLLVLLVFGVIHSIVGWWGDILLNYALLGFVLLAIERLPTRGILAFSALMMVVTTAIAIRFDTWFSPDFDDAERAREHAEYLAHELAIYRDGDFLTISRHRFDEMLAFFGQYNWSYRLNTVVMGSFGLWLERSGSLRRLTASAHHGRIAAALVVIGIAANASLALWSGHYILAGNVLAMGYAASFLWLGKRASFARVRDALVPIGRTAISAYLGQTVAFTLFFYGYGLAMYGQLGPTAALALACSVWLTEVVLAHAWLSRFTIGPVEWLWRSLTYLKVLPLSRA
ncbi:MAG: DUF418 domain-containing protein [Deltaproteobacteria bacterium]|nr:DUF418 domain-containing protein [Deltaproteobacteria bacterium]